MKLNLGSVVSERMCVRTADKQSLQLPQLLSEPFPHMFSFSIVPL